jgi:hypothetical protein
VGDRDFCQVVLCDDSAKAFDLLLPVIQFGATHDNRATGQQISVKAGVCERDAIRSDQQACSAQHWRRWRYEPQLNGPMGQGRRRCGFFRP